MSSLTASSSVDLPLFRPSLAHSLNSRGELGMFVNPYACSCVTCVDYVGEGASEPPAVAHEEPAPALTRSLTLGYAPSLAASAGGGAWAYAAPTPTPVSLTRSSSVMEGWGGEERPLFGSDLRPAPAPAAPALGRTVTGLGYTPSVVPEADAEEDESEDEADGAASAARRPALPGLGAVTPEEESLLVRLFNLRMEYKERQDEVYTEAYRSHDEAAAQDAEWTDLDDKIDAIEGVLRAFGVIIPDA